MALNLCARRATVPAAKRPSRSMLLSIVVPIHNAAAYLPAMLDSLYAQQYTEREVILVDDGSTDGSADILESYRFRDGATRGARWLARAIGARDMLHAVWRGVYSARFLRKAGVRFTPGLALRQDVPWTTEILAFARRMRYLPVSMYLYRVEVRRFDALRWKRLAQSHIKVLEQLERLNAEHAARLGAALPVLRWQIADQGMRIFHQTRRMPEAGERVAVYEEMRARGIDRLILRNARGAGQTWRALRRLGEMHLALAAHRLLGADAERLSHLFARAPRRRRAP